MIVSTNDHQRLLAALLRQDFPSFVRKVFETLDPGTDFQDNWHIDAMCNAIMEEWRAYNRPPDPTAPLGRDRRLMITVPPRHLKSIMTSIAFPAWVLGHDPSKRFMVASYAGELAALLTRDFRTVVQSQWYRNLFPNFGPLRQATATHVVTASGGGRLGVSLGGSVTGFGADIIIVDDLMKAQDAQSTLEQQRVHDFYQNTLLSRRNDKGHSIILVIQQRLHEYDLIVFLKEQGTYKHLNLAAIAQEDCVYDLGRGRKKLHKRGEALFEANEPLATLEKMRIDMGPVTFSSHYLQDPTPPEGGLLRWEKIATYEDPPHRNQCLMVVQSWDTAMRGEPDCDYSVGTTWGFYEECWLLLDVCRVRLDFPSLVERVRRERGRWRADCILVEDACSGISLLQSLREERSRLGSGANGHNCRIESYRPHSDKETRFAAQCEKLQSGLIKFPEDATWLPDLRKELVGFPGARYKDQVDSISQFLETSYLFERRRKSTVRRNITRR